MITETSSPRSRCSARSSWGREVFAPDHPRRRPTRCGIGLKVLEQGIDTATAKGRAMFGILSVLAEFQRELIAANTRDGLAAARARARGRKGVRPSKLGPDQIELTQQLYDAGEHTVAQIAAMLKVPRTTVYGHLDKKARRSQPTTPPEPSPPVRSSRICPTCGHEPTTRAEAAHQRADLAVDWLHLDPDRPGQLTIRHHCRHCEPDQPAGDIACTICGDGPILTGPSAAHMEIGSLPDSTLRWLTDAGWDTTPALRCPDHSAT
ncbi:recombinase family protein [Rhodococcus opacus]|uniref:recombinase family protein n=1 Tax=Rhodococcus TaxID=1827 RepID=UPI002949E3C9|nr:recombinase family protein [Rhodococcus opacus]MDV6247995.1 recombinase family protein [Rhodococcus opacus]